MLNTLRHAGLALNERGLGASENLTVGVELLHLGLGGLKVNLQLGSLEALDDLAALVSHTGNGLLNQVVVLLGQLNLSLDLLEGDISSLEPLGILDTSNLGVLDLGSQLVPKLDIVDRVGILAAGGREKRLGEDLLVERGNSTRSMAETDNVAGELLISGDLLPVEGVECLEVTCDLSSGLLAAGLGGDLRKSRVTRATLPVLKLGGTIPALELGLGHGAGLDEAGMVSLERRRGRKVKGPVELLSNWERKNC